MVDVILESSWHDDMICIHLNLSENIFTTLLHVTWFALLNCPVVGGLETEKQMALASLKLRNVLEMTGKVPKLTSLWD